MPSGRSDLVDITVKRLRETDAAVLVTSGDPDEAAWLPKSQIEIMPGENDCLFLVTLPEWLTIDKELV